LDAQWQAVSGWSFNVGRIWIAVSNRPPSHEVKFHLMIRLYRLSLHLAALDPALAILELACAVAGWCGCAGCSWPSRLGPGRIWQPRAAHWMKRSWLSVLTPALP
jgi:hypothetical protein